MAAAVWSTSTTTTTAGTLSFFSFSQKSIWLSSDSGPQIIKQQKFPVNWFHFILTLIFVLSLGLKHCPLYSSASLVCLSVSTFPAKNSSSFVYVTRDDAFFYSTFPLPSYHHFFIQKKKLPSLFNLKIDIKHTFAKKSEKPKKTENRADNCVTHALNLH